MKQRTLHLNPLVYLLITALSVFVAEGFVMLLFYRFADFLHSFSPQAIGIFDSVLVTAITFPILYLLLFRPLILEIKSRNQAQRELTESIQDLRTTHEELMQSEKLASIGQSTAKIVHDLKNPLGIILQGTDMLARQRYPNKKARDEALTVVQSAIIRQNKIISGLLDLSKPMSLQAGRYEMSRLMDEAMDLVEKQHALSHIDIIKDFTGETTAVLVDEERMKEVMINLLSNAVDAMPQGGTLTLRIYTKRFGKAGRNVGSRSSDFFHVGETALVCEVEDTGEGIPSENLDKIFDPFFTTKAKEKGTGLGLAIVRSIVKSHNGHIDIESRQGEGTIARLTLPLAESMA